MRSKSYGDTPIELERRVDSTPREAVAENMIEPALRHGHLVAELGRIMLEQLPSEQQPGLAEYHSELLRIIADAADGDMTMVGRLLAAQALSLDAIFTELARRSAISVDRYLNASERYMRMALKAQASCRATLEALNRLHQARGQRVRQFCVKGCDQAIVAHEVPPPWEAPIWKNAQTIP